MANTTNPRRNAEGYPDPTAYEALKNIDREEDERFHRLLHTLFYLCELAGFEIEGRIILSCGRSEADGVPFERIRRITGYLVGTLDKWNDAKRAEERDRVKHEVDSNFGD